MKRMVMEPGDRAEIDASLADVYRDLAIAPAACSLKSALNMIGVPVGGPRLPYVELDDAETSMIQVLLQRRAIDTGLSEVYREMGIAPAACTCKAALNLIGVEVGEPRLPYVPLDSDETALIGALLARRGLLQAGQA